MEDEKAYIVTIGMNNLLANNREHAFKLIELLSQAQPVDMKYVDSEYQITLTDRQTLSLDVRPLSDVDAEHL